MPGDGRAGSRVPTCRPRAIYLGQPRRAAPCRRLRLRHQAQHPPPAGRPRLPGHGRARRDAAGSGPRAQAGRGLPVERPGRPGRGRIRAGQRSARSPARGCPSSVSAWAISSSASHSVGRRAKMPFGHHGGNHPVRELATGIVTITSQNHGFAVQGNAGRDSWCPRAGRHAPEPQRRNRSRGCATGSYPSLRCSTIRRPRLGRTTPARSSMPSWPVMGRCRARQGRPEGPSPLGRVSQALDA